MRHATSRRRFGEDEPANLHASDGGGWSGATLPSVMSALAKVRDGTTGGKHSCSAMRHEHRGLVRMHQVGHDRLGALHRGCSAPEIDLEAVRGDAAQPASVAPTRVEWRRTIEDREELGEELIVLRCSRLHTASADRSMEHRRQRRQQSMIDVVAHLPAPPVDRLCALARCEVLEACEMSPAKWITGPTRRTPSRRSTKVPRLRSIVTSFFFIPADDPIFVGPFVDPGRLSPPAVNCGWRRLEGRCIHFAAIGWSQRSLLW
jgi:hypothetical protein